MREFWKQESEVKLSLTPAQADLFSSAEYASAREEMPHCELLPENSRICYSRLNWGDDFLSLGLPLLHELHGKPNDIFVVNFGHWHFDEAEYR